MANKELGTGAITAASALDGTEKFHLKQGANSREADIDMIKTFLAGLREETKLTKSGDQSIAVTTAVAVTWDQETRDEGTWHDTVTDNERVTPGEGIYDATLVIGFTGLAAGSSTQAYIRRYNSSDVLQETVAEFGGEELDGQHITITALNIRCAAGDYLQVEVQSADSAYDVVASGSYFLVRVAEISLATGVSNSISYADIPIDSPLSHTSNTNLLLEWDTPTVDTDSFWDVGNPSRIVAPFTGLYRVDFRVGYNTADSQFVFQSSLNLNRAGTTTFHSDFPVFSLDIYNADATFSKRHAYNAGGIIALTAADYLELVVYQFGTNRDVNGLSTFQIQYLGVSA